MIREEVRLTSESEPGGAFTAFKKNSAKKNEQSSAKSNKKLRKPKERKDVECFKCKEVGHYARDCKNKRKGQAKQNDPIFLGDNERCNVVGVGTIPIQKFVNVGVCTSRSFEVVFKKDSVKVVDRDKVLAIGIKQDNEIYRMLFREDKSRGSNEASVATSSLRAWHERLGHVNCRTLCALVNKELVSGIKLSDKNEFFCDSCKIGKSHRLEFHKCRERESTLSQHCGCPSGVHAQWHAYVTVKPITQ
ncbi:PREDICTED: uncharacterized protein LOC105555855 [Vollenhovia emeryi]|uniref:uncharacterized protein LOC105555855 n=1 Tax=Vollenhovia emeryi TaxID=411798 RepID=UPI0005F50081|nr:PREDICTED: uncharacterized protein LOC105555855 [Vollenhovia emeryi]